MAAHLVEVAVLEGVEGACRNIRRQFRFGKELFINEFEFVGKKSAFFSASEGSVCIRISFVSHISRDEMRILLRLTNSEQNVLGIYLSDCFPVKENEEKEFIFNADISMLAPDTYFYCVEVEEFSSNGSHRSYDNPGINIRFEITDDNAQEITWFKKYWGNLRFKDLVFCPITGNGE